MGSRDKKEETVPVSLHKRVTLPSGRQQCSLNQTHIIYCRLHIFSQAKPSSDCLVVTRFLCSSPDTSPCGNNKHESAEQHDLTICQNKSSYYYFSVIVCHYMEISSFFQLDEHPLQNLMQQAAILKREKLINIVKNNLHRRFDA